MNHVCPGLGVLIAIITFGSPLPALLEADKTGDIKSLNPLPFIAMAANCTLGSLYGQITHDWYLWVANTAGVLLSWFYILTSQKFLGAKEQRRVTLVTLAAVVVFVVVGTINLTGAVNKQQLWGSTAVTLLGLYYIAPLTSLFKVLKERDSSSIYWPLSLANLANAMLWMVYGMAKKDWFFIAMPNAMGVAFNTASLILCVILPARDRQSDNSSSQEPGALKKLLRSLRGKKCDDESAVPIEECDSHEIDLAVEAVTQHQHAK